MPRDLTYREAIIEVLKSHSEPLHYADIAEKISEQELRPVGANPAATVNATVHFSLTNEGDSSPFVRTGRGIIGLREKLKNYSLASGGHDDEVNETGLINAFGMYWARDKVSWTSTPKILGEQQAGATKVDFCDQIGVYLLHDSRSVVYVGRTTDQPLGRRLWQHTTDRLNGRWDRFSWFGVRSVGENGELLESDSGNLTIESLIVTMEALLIEGLEPPQNRKRGDDFRAIEYLQAEDPEIARNRIQEAITALLKKL